MKKFLIAFFAVLVCFGVQSFAQIPTRISVAIVKAEDERRFDKTLEDLLKNADEKIRTRAALAVGRIGDEKSVPMLVNLLETDKSTEVRTMAAFALGEVESITATNAIINVLMDAKANPQTRARAIEAAGKIAAANAKDEKSKQLGAAILETLQFEDEKRSAAFDEIVELGLTAVFRARPENAEKTLVRFIDAYTPKVRANALNALARLRAKNANRQARELLQKDANAIVRANAARVLGAAEDKDAFDILLKAATTDLDSRVRVSAIRAVGNLKDAKAAEKLLERAENLFAEYKKSKSANPSKKSELLEIATTLGRILPNANDEKAIEFLTDFGLKEYFVSPEIHIAFAKISPAKFLEIKPPDYICSVNSNTNFCWQFYSGYAQGLGELANLDEGNSLRAKAADIIKKQLRADKKYDLAPDHITEQAIPDKLRAFASFKTNDVSEIVRGFLTYSDVFVRATAAELLGEQTATKENVEALKIAFVQALEKDKDSNDAQLAILSALVKLDKKESFESLRLALNAPDYLLRKHAANLIKENDLTKDFSNIEEMVGTLEPYNPNSVNKRIKGKRSKLGRILNTEADYVRAVSRKSAKAIITTEKGNFTIEFFPEDAPLTVDNFIKLAKSNYFNNVSIHRVVPNFVMQDGDPRGDGSGGPGWQIRCELNMKSYERGAVGMALSGKDTGGSQWFVTHSPQPHLDGGYTVFGKVNETDMKIVDNLVRGDKILSVKIIEGNAPTVVKAKSRK